MANFGTTEILIVLAVVMLLFGSAKLPQLARSIGRSARILKAETRGLHEDDPLLDEPADGPRRQQGALPAANPLPPHATVQDPARPYRT